MRIVIQRVKKATVTIDNSIFSEIGVGLLVLVGIEDSDCNEDIKYLVGKMSKLRIFDDNNGIMNLSVLDIDGDILIVSQFTLFANTEKGNRPSYIRSAKPSIALPIYEKFCKESEIAIGKSVKTGLFGANMSVELTNDGPVTILIDSKQR